MGPKLTRSNGLGPIKSEITKGPKRNGSGTTEAETDWVGHYREIENWLGSKLPMGLKRFGCETTKGWNWLGPKLQMWSKRFGSETTEGQNGLGPKLRMGSKRIGSETTEAETN